MAKEPRKHHYIPEFYLKGWADENGKMWRYDRPHLAVVHKHVFPSQVGFVKDLYTIPGVAPEFAQKIETEWFSRVDHAASQAREKLFETPHSGWSSVNRSAWTRFIFSLAHRTPENLAVFKESMRIIWGRPSPKIQAKYELIRKPTDPACFEDYAQSVDPLIVEKFASLAIQRPSGNSQMGHFINNMHWKVYDLSESQFLLLLSDALLVMSNGLKKPDGHIAIPLSPTKLFVATYDKAFMSEFDRMSPQQLVRKTNQLVVGRAKRFVVAANRDQDAFIRKRFGSDDTPSLMDMVLSQVQFP